MSKIRGFYEETSLIKIIYEMRRSGKSVILIQIIDEIDDSYEKYIISLDKKAFSKNGIKHIYILLIY